MNLNEIIIFKIVAFFLCENIFLKLIIFLLFLIDIINKNKGIKLKKNLKQFFCGCFLIIINCFFNINFMWVNFFVLGVGSSFLHKIKAEKYISIYLFLLGIQGGITFCLKF